MDDDINSLINSFEYNKIVQFKPKQSFFEQINVIIKELINYHSYINIDIYEVLVSCGHNLTWNQDYYITHDDLNWFKNDVGKVYFYNSINNVKPIINIDEHNSICDIHNKLIELFELQVE